MHSTSSYLKTAFAFTACIYGTVLFADDTSELPAKSDTQMAYVYATAYEYDGYGALGALGNEFYRLDSLYFDTASHRNIDGTLAGVTAGYEKTLKKGDTLLFEAEYVSGKPDADYSTSHTKTYALDTSTSVLVSDLEGNMEIDVHKLSLRFQYANPHVKFLTFGMEYAYSDIVMTCNYRTYITGDNDGLDVHFTGYTTGKTDFGMESSDVLLNVTAAPGKLYVFNKGNESLYFIPEAKLGMGYSFRDCDDGYSYYRTYYYDYGDDGTDSGSSSGYVTFADDDETYNDNEEIDYNSDQAGKIPDDAWIYDVRAGCEITYMVRKTSLTLLLGYRFEGDFDESDNSVEGVYAKLGFQRVW